MFCSKCGKALADGSLFCNYCGAKMNHPPIANQPLSNNQMKSPVKQAPENADFKMKVDNAVAVSQVGLVLTGKIEKGEICIHQCALIPETGDTRYSVIGLEKNGTRVESAAEGDIVGIVLDGLDVAQKEQIIGKYLVSDNGNSIEAEQVNYESVFADLAGPISAVHQDTPSVHNAAVSEMPMPQFSQQQQAPSRAPQQPAGVNQTPVVPNPSFNPSQNAQAFHQGQNAQQFNQAQNAQPFYPYQNPGALSILVNLKTGSGFTAFSAMNAGKLSVSENGVFYEIKLGSNSHSHSYQIEQIAQTQFTITHAGLQPYFGYTVGLKNGTNYTYIYSPFQKSKMNAIDAFIKSKM